MNYLCRLESLSKLKGGVSVKSVKNPLIFIYVPRYSIVKGESADKISEHQGNCNPLKMNVEIVKNGINNVYSFGFLALLKTPFLLTIFNRTQTIFQAHIFFGVILFLRCMRTKLQSRFFDFRSSFLTNMGKAWKKWGFSGFFTRFGKFYKWPCSNKTKSKLKNPAL